MSEIAFNIFGIGLLIGFITCVLFVLFGQITVRKLRKNPETKAHLGIEFVSGWDILNVASALAMPLCLSHKLSSTPLAFMYADATLLQKHTNRLDRMLARIFCTFFYSTGIIIIPIAFLDSFGLLGA